MHCYKCDDSPTYNFGDVLFKPIMEVLTQFGVVKNGHVVGMNAEQQEKTLLEMNLLVNAEFQFSMVCFIIISIKLIYRMMNKV